MGECGWFHELCLLTGVYLLQRNACGFGIARTGAEPRNDQVEHQLGDAEPGGNLQMVA